MRCTLRPGSDAAHRAHAARVSRLAPRPGAEVTAVRDLRRAHIERYKRHVAQKPNLRGGRLSRSARSWLVLDAADLPGAAGRVGRRGRSRADTDVPRRRAEARRSAAVVHRRWRREETDPGGPCGAHEICSRAWRWSSSPAPGSETRGQFLDQKIDPIVQIVLAKYRRHVPLGKLRTDRYIPLHLQLKELLDEWVARWLVYLRRSRGCSWTMAAGSVRGERSAKRSRRLPAKPALTMSRRISCATRWRRRAINRGMSWQAIAALLGYESMRMTMVSTRRSSTAPSPTSTSCSCAGPGARPDPQTAPAGGRGVGDAQAARRDAPADARHGLLCTAGRAGLGGHFESICESVAPRSFRPRLSSAPP